MLTSTWEWIRLLGFLAYFYFTVSIVFGLLRKSTFVKSHKNLIYQVHQNAGWLLRALCISGSATPFFISLSTDCLWTWDNCFLLIFTSTINFRFMVENDESLNMEIDPLSRIASLAPISFTWHTYWE